MAAAAALATGLASLSTDVMVRVALCLKHDEVDSMRMLYRSLLETLSDEELWKPYVASRYFPFRRSVRPLAPLRPDGEACSAVGEVDTWRECAFLWRELARLVETDERELSPETWMSVASSWRVVEKFANECEIGLLGPASREDLARVPTKSLRYAYAMHAGQVEHVSTLRALFGSFSVYDYNVSQAFYPIGARAMYFRGGRSLALVSANATSETVSRPRAVTVDDEDSRVEMAGILAAPEGVGFAGYFAEFASRIRTGYYRVVPVAPYSPVRVLQLFPDSGDELAEATTNGVNVRVSAIYLHHRQVFVYSVRLKLLREGRCQLRTRRWTFASSDRDSHPQHVVGDGVVGKFPKLICSPSQDGQLRSTFRDDSLDSFPAGNSLADHLEQGEHYNGEFIYQSLTGHMPRGGTFKGLIDFVPGDLRDPAGDVFQVVVPECTLNPHPTYIF